MRRGIHSIREYLRWYSLHWRHNDHDGVSNHQPHGCLFTVHSDADQREHQSSASLAFVWGIHRDRWIPRTKGQLRRKIFHLMTSSGVGLCRSMAIAKTTGARLTKAYDLTIQIYHKYKTKVNKMHNLRCMGCNFFVKFWRRPLKFGAHTQQNMPFMRCKKLDELWYPRVVISEVLVRRVPVRTVPQIIVTDLPKHRRLTLLQS